jgi:protein TonB
MDLARLLAKLMDKTGERLLKAIVFSTALHLGLILLIQPARWTGPNEVVLQARIAAATTQTAAHPSVAAEAEAGLPESLIAEVPIPSDMVSTAAPTQAQAVPQPTEAVSGADAQAPTAQAEEIKTGEPGVAAAGSATALPEIPVMLDTRWYTAREVDVLPRPTQPVQPQYPEEARLKGQQGSVVLQLRIDQFGVVHDIEVVESTPPGVFDQACLDAFGAARFLPAQRDGRPVRALVKIRVTFELD